MKILSLIPSKIRKDYAIVREGKTIYITNPQFISFEINSSFKVADYPENIKIFTNRCSIYLNKSQISVYTIIHK